MTKYQIKSNSIFIIVCILKTRIDKNFRRNYQQTFLILINTALKKMVIENDKPTLKKICFFNACIMLGQTYLSYLKNTNLCKVNILHHCSIYNIKCLKNRAILSSLNFFKKKNLTSKIMLH